MTGHKRYCHVPKSLPFRKRKHIDFTLDKNETTYELNMNLNKVILIYLLIFLLFECLIKK